LAKAKAGNCNLCHVLMIFTPPAGRNAGPGALMPTESAVCLTCLPAHQLHKGVKDHQIQQLSTTAHAAFDYTTYLQAG
jgi:hypothetical protein